MAPVEKRAVQESQATVEFTPSFVIPNPRNGVYAARLDSGYLKITLPEKEKNELLSLLRSNPASAQAWLDSTTEAIRAQYERANSQKFTFALQAIGVPAQTRDTSAFRPPDMGRAEAPQPRSRGGIIRMQQGQEVEKPGISVPWPAVVSGTGTRENPFVAQFPELVGEKDAIGSVPVTIHPELRFVGIGWICYEITLQQAYLTDLRLASTTEGVFQFITSNVFSTLDKGPHTGLNAANLAQAAGRRVAGMVSAERLRLFNESKKLAQYLSEN